MKYGLNNLKYMKNSKISGCKIKFYTLLKYLFQQILFIKFSYLIRFLSISFYFFNQQFNNQRLNESYTRMRNFQPI